MEARGMTDKEEWFVWNGSIGILDSVTIGAVEHGAGLFRRAERFAGKQPIAPQHCSHQQRKRQHYQRTRIFLHSDLILFRFLNPTRS